VEEVEGSRRRQPANEERERRARDVLAISSRHVQAPCRACEPVKFLTTISRSSARHFSESRY
jgi:hypothetical protein